MPTFKQLSGRKTAETMRKLPTQERAQRTIETIFEATAQIVDESGEASLTTNKIAQKAGFSIGTLYQYFPTKEAILLAMIHQGRRQVMDDMHAMMMAAVKEGADPEQIIRVRLRTLIEAFGSGGTFKRSLIRLAWRMDHHDNITQAIREGAEQIGFAMSQLRSPLIRPASAVSLFILTRAVMGTIRSASLEDSPLLGTQEFEDELVRMVWGMLKA